MTGLNYIRKDIFHMTVTWLADQIKISRQGITDWESGRSKMLDNRLDILEQLFGVSKQWYDKEVSEMDKLKIDNEVLNNVISKTIYNNIQFFDDIDLSKSNVRFGETTVDLEKIMRIEDIYERNNYIMKQIEKNDKKIAMLENLEKIKLKGNNLSNNTTLFNMYINCLNIFDDITNKIILENSNVQDIEFANLKQYLMNYKDNKNNV